MTWVIRVKEKKPLWPYVIPAGLGVVGLMLGLLARKRGGIS